MGHCGLAYTLPFLQKHEFSVDMNCEGCAEAVSRVLNKLGGEQLSTGERMGDGYMGVLFRYVRPTRIDCRSAGTEVCGGPGAHLGLCSLAYVEMSCISPQPLQVSFIHYTPPLLVYLLRQSLAK